MNLLKRILLPGLFIAFGTLVPHPGFAQNRDMAKPWVFWYWMQAAVSKPGITADLEAMKQAGIGGAYLMSIKGPTKPPLYTPVAEQLSQHWWDLVRFSVQEAKRLDLKVGMHVSDGFALAGGPWIRPEMSMQKVVFSSKTIAGGKISRIVLEQPETIEGYYRDIAVFAFPALKGSGISTATIKPLVTTSSGADASFLVLTGNKKTFSSSDPCWIQYQFDKPFTIRKIVIRTNGNNYQSQRLLLQASEDGVHFRPVGRLHPPRHGWQDTDEPYTHVIDPVTANYFRFVYDKKGSEPGAEDLDAAKWKPSLKVAGIQLFSEPGINQIEAKRGAVWRIAERTTSKQLPDDLCVSMDKIINLSSKLNPDGSLNWSAPEGKWTILRIGHTSTGHTNATAGAGRGLECDKFNPEAVKLQFDHWYGEALRQVGPELTPSVLNTFHVDSWECGSQNWSPVFRDEFKKRRGYDLMPFLPIMAGVPVQSAQVSESFLYDVRQTIAELVLDSFYKTLAGLAREQGVIFTAESVAPTMVSDGLLHYKTVDIPMGEFWLNSPTHDKPNDMLDAISGAHIYGKKIIQAEAFTTVRMAWNEHPGMLKTLQDRNYALGINKLSYHVFTQNPWLDRKPGMTLDGVGLYFQRDQTWWKAGRAWVEYAERCQQLLQQGTPVADIAVFTGEEVPRRSVLPERLVPVLPGLFGPDVVASEKLRLANVGEPLRQKPAGVSHSANMADPENWINPLRGYAYDSFNPDALLGAQVSDGRVVFESGASYSLLVIPGKLAMNPNSGYMSFAVANKLLELLNQGARVLMMEKPLMQPGLQKRDSAAFSKIVDQIWSGTFTGRLIKGPFQKESLSELGLERDMLVKDENGNYADKLAYTHRSTEDADIYFLSNQEDRQRTLIFSFRVSGRQPVIYDPVNGTIIQPGEWQSGKGKTTLPMRLEPHGSVFIVFGKEPGSLAKNMGGQLRKSSGKNWFEYESLKTVSGSWNVKFDPALGGPKEVQVFSELSDWSKSADSTIQYYSGTTVYSKDIKLKSLPREPVYLDLGKVANIAEVSVNGIPCGIAWTPPYRIDISQAIRKGNNNIRIEVTNTWANRLIGDHRLPEDQRLTRTTAPYRLEGKPLEESGLMGPVQLITEKEDD